MRPDTSLRPGAPLRLAASLRGRLAIAALICIAGVAAPVGRQSAWADDCSSGAGPSGAGSSGAGPSGAAGTSALYGELAGSVSAEPLSVDITAKAIGGTCTWVYEVKVLTVSGTVALLDFDLVDLDLKQVEGSPDDPEVARLMERLKDRDSLADDGPKGGQSADDGGDGNSAGGESGGGSGGSGSGGSGGGGSGSEGGDGGGDGGDGGGSEGGSDGGGGGSDGGGGGEGGEGGGDD